jgi:DNA-binding GntR family transcriptional regulator
MQTSTSLLLDPPPVIQAPPASSLLEGQQGGSDTERVYNQIFDAVMDRRLLPGAKLTESALCKIANCSRATVRAALAELAHDHIVTIEPNRGAFVARPGPKETRDVFTMRQALECLVLQQLLQLPDLAQRLEPLYDMVAQEQTAFLSGDRISWLRLSNAFHVRLASVLGNDVLTELMHGLCARTTIIIAQHAQPQENTCSYTEHQHILDGLLRGDYQGVAKAMQHHLADCLTRLEQSDGQNANPWSAFSVKL